MSYLDLFSKPLGLSPDHAEDALHSESAAKLVLSRRVFLGAVGATSAAAMLSAGTVYSFAPASPMSSVHLLVDGQVVRRWMPGERISSFSASKRWTVYAQVVHVELRRVARATPLVNACFHASMGFGWQAGPCESILA